VPSWIREKTVGSDTQAVGLEIPQRGSILNREESVPVLRDGEVDRWIRGAGKGS
jgi:hypothetical protein